MRLVEDIFHMMNFREPTDVWRKQSDDNKQASEGELNKFQSTSKLLLEYGDLMRKVEETYKRFIDMRNAQEQLVILPLSQYTLVYWTTSFQSVMNFIELRDEPTSQWKYKNT